MPKVKEAPHNKDAEMAAIGCILMEADLVLPVAINEMQMKPECFYLPNHQQMFEGILDLYAKKGAVDQLMLEEWFTTERPESAKDIDIALSDCVEAAVTTAHAAHYLEIVRSKYILRRMIEISREIEVEAQKKEDGEDLLKTAPARYLEVIGDVVKVEENADVMDRLKSRWREAKDGGKPATGLELPFPALNQILCGLEPGVTILAARPSVGKTTMEDMIACHAAAKGIAVARSTLDSNRDELLARALCRMAGVSLPKLKFGFAGESQLAKIQQESEVLAKYPMFINDTDREWQAIATWARMMKKRHNIGLLTLDFIQLVMAGELGQAQHNQVTRVTHVSTALKGLSSELGIPVLVLSQLSRSVEKEGRNPQLSDLRDSGAIEQDATKVVFLYKDQKVAQEMEEAEPGATKKERPTWADVMKQKDGELGRIPYWLHAPYFMFEEIDSDYPFASGPQVQTEETYEPESYEQSGLMPGGF